MATEKILNTRIGLKIDTLENWGKSTLPLKKGEVAFATVAATAGTGLTEPVVMMKIGEDGVKTFKDIEWNFYAKASDVLAACKSEDALKTFVNGVIADAGIASNDAMEELAKKVTANETAITTLNGNAETAGSVAKAIKDAIDALDLANTYVAIEEGKSLMTDAEHTKLAGISEGANKVENVGDGKIKIDGTEVTVYVHPEKHAIADVDGLQGALDGKQAVGDYATKSEAQGYADAKDGAIEAAKKAGDDAAAALETYKGEMTTALAGKQDTIPENTYDAYGAAAQALEDAKKYADEHDANDNTEYHVEYDSVNKKIKLVAGADASKMEIPTDDFIKDGMIQSVAISEDGKNLVITWNTDAGKEATTIALSELVDVMTGVDGTTVTVNVSADDKISAEIKTNSIMDGHIASDAAIAKGKLASDVQTSLGLADSAVQEADIADLRSAKHTHTFNDTDVADAISKKHSHTFDETVLNGITSAKVEAWDAAEQNAKDYADDQIEALGLGTMSKETATNYYTKSEADATFTDATEVDNQIDAKITALDLANTYQAKGEYATAAQGAKADTAIQSVTSVAGNGIKATTDGTAVTIDWDSEVTLIFDCGDSGVTA